MVDVFRSGTGASVIYPLLATTLLPPPPPAQTPTPASPPTTPRHPTLSILATELDPHSFTSASLNLTRNDLHSRIALVKVDPPPPTSSSPTQPADATPSAPIFSPALWSAPLLPIPPHIDFTLCNPPFYASDAEIAVLEGRKLAGPFARCTGAANEMLTPGGEVAFVRQMIGESLAPPNRERIGVFSSLLGKFSSVAPVVACLREYGVGNYGIRVLGEREREGGVGEGRGGRRGTRRWVVLWSHGERRVPDCGKARLDPGLVSAGVLPRQTEWRSELPSGPATEPGGEGAEAEAWCAVLEEVWREAAVTATALPLGEAGDGEAGGPGARAVARWQVVATKEDGNSWSRVARRKRARLAAEAAGCASSQTAEPTAGGNASAGGGTWVACEAWLLAPSRSTMGGLGKGRAGGGGDAQYSPSRKRPRLPPGTPQVPDGDPEGVAGASDDGEEAVAAAPGGVVLHLRWVAGPDAARADVEGLWGFAKGRMK